MTQTIRHSRQTKKHNLPRFIHNTASCSLFTILFKRKYLYVQFCPKENIPKPKCLIQFAVVVVFVTILVVCSGAITLWCRSWTKIKILKNSLHKIFEHKSAVVFHSLPCVCKEFQLLVTYTCLEKRPLTS